GIYGELLVEVLVLLRFDDGVVSAAANEDLFAFGGENSFIDIVEDGLAFAFFEIVVQQRGLFVDSPSARHFPVNQFAVHRGQISEVARLRREHHCAAFEVLEVNFDWLGSFLFFFLLFGFSIFFFFLGGVRLVFRLLFLGSNGGFVLFRL